MRCSLQVLSAWAEHVTSLQLSRLLGAWRRGSAEEGGEDEALVRGEAGKAPHLRESVRYWGTDVLVPLGFRADPDLPAAAIRGLVGAGDGDLVVLDKQGIELIPLGAFQPLSRAGILLARGGSAGSGPKGGRVT